MPSRSGFALGRSPSIAQGRLVHDFIKGRITALELAANVPDDRSDIHSKTRVAGPCDEAFVVKAVVDGAIRHVPTSIGRQEVNDLVLAHRQPDVVVAPKRPADSGSQDQPAADELLFGSWSPGNRCALDQSLETADQNVDSTRLVDEVDGSALQGERFPVGQGMARQKDDGQGAAGAAQLRQEVNAGNRRQDPVQYDEIGAGQLVERCQKPRAVGEALDRKAAFCQLPAERLAEIIVVLDEQDAYGVLVPVQGQRPIIGQNRGLLHVSFFPV